MSRPERLEGGAQHNPFLLAKEEAPRKPKREEEDVPDPDDVLAKLAAFLPRMKQSNEDLERRMKQGEDVSMEVTGEEPHVRMDFALKPLENEAEEREFDAVCEDASQTRSRADKQGQAETAEALQRFSRVAERFCTPEDSADGSN
ncbi:MAG: hypothetical protein MHM6MM_002198 [Cercozoa sp. M6MM]